MWYLPGIAERFKLEESVLRRKLFEQTGGMFPELVTRPDLKLFLPPINGVTVYIVGDVSSISKPDAPLVVRLHDESCAAPRNSARNSAASQFCRRAIPPRNSPTASPPPPPQVRALGHDGVLRAVVGPRPFQVDRLLPRRDAAGRPGAILAQFCAII